MSHRSSHDIDARQLRNALGTFATGVAIVTTVAEDGEPLGLTVNSFSSVSLDPPLVLFCLARRAYSYPHFAQCAAFAVNILAADQRELSGRFASPSTDKWRGVSFDVSENGCPVFSDALAVFQCSTRVVHEAGDHIIVVGRVEAFLTDRVHDPLLFYRGRYAHLGV